MKGSANANAINAADFDMLPSLPRSGTHGATRARENQKRAWTSGGGIVKPRELGDVCGFVHRTTGAHTGSGSPARARIHHMQRSTTVSGARQNMTSASVQDATRAWPAGRVAVDARARFVDGAAAFAKTDGRESHAGGPARPSKLCGR